MPLSENCLPTLVPPITSTLPSGKTTEFCIERAYVIDSIGVMIGALPFRSIVMAVLTAGSPPPAKSIFPTSYITVVL